MIECTSVETINTKPNKKEYKTISFYSYKGDSNLNLVSGIIIGYGERICVINKDVYYQTYETNKNNTYIKLSEMESNFLIHNLENLFEFI